MAKYIIPEVSLTLIRMGVYCVADSGSFVLPVLRLTPGSPPVSALRPRVLFRFGTWKSAATHQIECVVTCRRGQAHV
jgi:hypothetical protein